jgi:transcriptional regulator with XRE-family HTH domain
MAIVADVILRELLRQHGVTTIEAFWRRLGVTKQYGWLLWHGKIGLSGAMIKRIHDTFEIPLEELVLVERATPPKRRGPQRKPPRQSPEEDSSTEG